MLTDGPDTDSIKIAPLYSFLEKTVSSSSSVIFNYKQHPASFKYVTDEYDILSKVPDIK